MLKSWERSSPPLGWPRRTDSLCPECVKAARADILSGAADPQILIEEHVAEIKAQILVRDGKVVIEKACPNHGTFTDTLAIDPAFLERIESLFPGRDFEALTDRLHNHGMSSIKYGRLDVGLGLLLADGVTDLDVDVRIRRLLVHQAAGFAESGMSVSVSYDPTPKTPLGFTARVSPSWGGEATSGADALWGRESMGSMGRDHLLGEGATASTLRSATACRSERGSSQRHGSGSGRRSTAAATAWATACRLLEQGGLNLELGIKAERRESPVFHHLQDKRAGADQRVIGHARLGW